MEDNFKDIEKNEARILKKKPENSYDVIKLSDYEDVLKSYHHIKFFIRVFSSQKTKDGLGSNTINEINNRIDKIVNEEIASFNSNR
ncbi:hypothetical protein [Yersinia intermedia]|uniref:Uncharacterized protein n=1 Tax=Yersinia intermedia TaxID=631 RepID=A0A0T9LR53_YERIN|nr:hypothetical protein [Yersinia intermedia]CNF17051.1 Uncharacterised protein [Yersinia intermedia]